MLDLTEREAAAALILSGLVAHPYNSYGILAQEAAKKAIEHADALLFALGQTAPTIQQVREEAINSIRNKVARGMTLVTSEAAKITPPGDDSWLFIGQVELVVDGTLEFTAYNPETDDEEGSGHTEVDRYRANQLSTDCLVAVNENLHA